MLHVPAHNDPMVIFLRYGSRYLVWPTIAMLVCSSFCFASKKSENKKLRESPNALQILVDLPMKEAVEAVHEVAGDGIIHGTQSYERERNLTGAELAETADAFGPYTGNGTVLYKVADSVLSPKNFKNSADMGRITVRYILSPLDAKNTNLRIDAIFIERTTRRVHESDGSVEAAEFAEIRQHVEKIQANDAIEKDEEARVAQERKEKQQELDLVTRQDAAHATSDSMSTDLEHRVMELRKKVELRVAASGTELKSAPYKSAASIKVLPPFTNLLVVIVTPYWYGVETEDGHRGWVHHSEVVAMQ